MTARLIVIGAGPVGVAAALGGIRRGLDVTVFERDQVGAALRRWGPTKFFSPLDMNLPLDAAAILGSKAPPIDAILSGAEFADRVLVPLVESPPLAGRVRTGHRVLAVGRAGLTRSEYANHPIRSERSFRVLVATPEGERQFEAEAVLDASGTYDRPVAVGAGGIPVPGEPALAGRMIRTLGNLADRRRSLAGRRVLLVGHGHSATNAILELETLCDEASSTRVVWAVRAPNLRPCVEVDCDPLPERQRVAARANELATKPPLWLKVERRASVERLDPRPDNAVKVSLSGGRDHIVDEIVGLTGYRPDLTMVSELAIEVSPSTEGAARLARALSNVTDCLSVPAILPDDLFSGEPGFYLVGAKSYGRVRTFLLKTGYAQLETILDRIASEPR